MSCGFSSVLLEISELFLMVVISASIDNAHFALQFAAYHWLNRGHK